MACGHICDDFFGAKFPLFKICFTLIGLMVITVVVKKDEEETEQ